MRVEAGGVHRLPIGFPVAGLLALRLEGSGGGRALLEVLRVVEAAVAAAVQRGARGGGGARHVAAARAPQMRGREEAPRTSSSSSSTNSSSSSRSRTSRRAPLVVRAVGVAVKRLVAMGVVAGLSGPASPSDGLWDGRGRGA